jgi:hypothetical protein
MGFIERTPSGSGDLHPTLLSIKASPYQTPVWAFASFFGLISVINSIVSFDHVPTMHSIGVKLAITFIGMSVYITFLLWSRFQWFELDGDVLPGKRALTRTTYEWPWSDIVSIEPYIGLLRFRIVRKELKISDFGYEVRFRVGKRLRLIRSDIKRLDEFVATIKEQLAHVTS